MRKLILVLLIILIVPTFSYLEVYIPKCAHTIIPDSINHTLSNFGFIPYGQTYIGRVFTSQAPGNSELCTIDSEPRLKSDSSKSFLLVKRGGCKFTQKVLNGQKLGADLVIIYDNDTSSKPHLIMKNDGHGHLVSIPSIFISSQSGQAIIKTLIQCSQSVFLKQVFEVFQTQIVSLSLWLDLNNRQSYILLRDFYQHEYYNVIEQNVNTTVKFNVYYGCQDLYCEPLDCIGSEENQYCLPMERHANDSVLTGSELLKESLRMYVLFDMLPENKNQIWYQYMDKFDQNLCFEIKDIETCSYDTMEQCGVSGELIDAIKLNVTSTLKSLDSKTFNEDNVFYYIEKQADQKNIVFYPEAVINGKNFYGLFKAPEVFQMICSSLLDQPKQCYSLAKNTVGDTKNIDKTDDLWLTVLMIVFLMTLGFVIAMFVYARLIKKEVNQEMSIQVNKMVENYVNLAQQKSISEQNTGSYNKVEP